MMVSQLAVDKRRFFSQVNLTESPFVQTAKARNRSRYRYEVLPMTADIVLENNKLYVKRGDSGLEYKYLTPAGELKEGSAKDLSTLLINTADKGHNGFHFVAQHRLLIEQEFIDLYAALLNNLNNPKEFWLYCYSICFDLENYYLDDAYPNPVEAAKYHRLRKMLEYRCENDKFPPEVIHQDIEVGIGRQISAAIADLIDTIRHTSAIRGWLGFVNLYRILFVFSRLAVKQSLVLVNELKWLERLSNLIGQPLDVNAILAMINAPNGIFNLLSVGLFEVRLCIILCEVLKHTFVSTEKEKSRSKSERLKQELFERCLDIYNDLAWSIVNTLCNYGYLADPIAYQLTALFLLFDAMALFARHYLARRDYLLKKEQYEAEILFYKNLPTCTLEQIDQQIAVLNKQNCQLDIEWGANSAKLLFLAAGSILLMGGFSAALLLAAPAAITACFVACTVAVAMFLSSGQYQAYAKASLVYAQQDDVINAAAVGNTRWSFYKTMTKNTLMPLAMVTAFALYWPAALLLAAGYIANERRGASPTPPLVTPDRLTAELERDRDLQYLEPVSF